MPAFVTPWDQTIVAMNLSFVLELMCQDPPDTARWIETPFFRFDPGAGRSHHLQYMSWEQAASHEQRCCVIRDIDYAFEFLQLVQSLALETAACGGPKELDTILSRRRPTLLPNLQAFLIRGLNTFQTAGSWEAIRVTARAHMSHHHPRWLRSLETQATNEPAKTDHELTDEQKQTGELVLQRSAQLMDSFMGEGSSAAFMRGDVLLIKGDGFDFAVSKKDDNHVAKSFTTRYAHIPYNLILRTPAGTDLARGCLISKDAPILDQITNLFAHVVSGKTKEVIKITNWFDRAPGFYTALGYNAPAPLPSRIPPPNPTPPQATERAEQRFVPPSDQWMRRLDEGLLPLWLAEAGNLQAFVSERLIAEMTKVDVSYIFDVEGLPTRRPLALARPVVAPVSRP